MIIAFFFIYPVARICQCQYTESIRELRFFFWVLNTPSYSLKSLGTLFDTCGMSSLFESLVPKAWYLGEEKIELETHR